MDVRIAMLAGALGLALAGCTSSNPQYVSGGPVYGSGAAGVCVDCGVVQQISSYTGERRGTTGAGAVVGAVVGGIVGNNVEKNRAGGTWYELHVLMGDGRTVVVTQDDLNGIREGTRVRLRDGRAYLD